MINPDKIALSRSYRLPMGYQVEFTLTGPQLVCAWYPRLPEGKKARKLQPHYRAARSAFFASVGAQALVIEL